MHDRYKFRAWHKTEEKMYEVHGLSPGHISVLVNPVSSNATFFILEKCILMQSTGLRDKNGVLIYDHDVVKTDECDWVAKVEWSRDILGCYNKGFSFLCNWENFEVLGNLYENKELEYYFGEEY
jgi:uncharacterized phage protein (TIGR01671 family)